jgi:hypothetical protein
VHKVPADRAAPLALQIERARVVVPAAGHPVPGAALNAPELLDASAVASGRSELCRRAGPKAAVDAHRTRYWWTAWCECRPTPDRVR